MNNTNLLKKDCRRLLFSFNVMMDLLGKGILGSMNTICYRFNKQLDEMSYSTVPKNINFKMPGLKWFLFKRQAGSEEK